MSAKDSITPTLRICNCAGGAISETQLDRAAQAPGTASERGRLLTMGWTDGEMLVMVRERGGVEVRDIMVSVDIVVVVVVVDGDVAVFGCLFSLLALGGFSRVSTAVLG